METLMIRHMFQRCCYAVLAVAAALAAAPITLPAQERPLGPEASVDAVFSAWTSSTPGCVVGVSQGGRIVLQKAYGMADLEHDVRNTPDTIFEAGSVSKQFTAAAPPGRERWEVVAG
jgi:CubicO group peptidase (beta-lactamase class C family)